MDKYTTALEIRSNNKIRIQPRTYPITTLRKLAEVRLTPTAKALLAGDVTAIVQSVGSQISEIIDRPNIVMLKKVVNPLAIEIVLASEIQKLTQKVNVDARLNIQPEQIPVIAAQLIELFPAESLEDFILCFQRGATGFYGSIYRLDAAVLIEWMRGNGKEVKGYLDEKYSLIEAEEVKSKQALEESNSVNYEAFKKRLSMTMANEKELETKDAELKRKRLFQRMLGFLSRDRYKNSETELQRFVDDDGYFVNAANLEEAEEIFIDARRKMIA